MIFYFGLLGLIIGSFLNVLVLRLSTGRTFSGRSACFSCNKELSAFELLPVISYMIQRGRCRTCSAHISWQYPLVELLTAFLFGLIAWRYEDNLIIALYLCILAAILIAIVVYDFRHKIIPDKLVYLFIVLSALTPIYFCQTGDCIRFTQLLISFIPASTFGLLWLVSNGRWMGLGDAKLALGMGLLLGSSGVFFASLIAFWTGALVGILLLLIRKGVTIKSEIPFAPFLVFGTFVQLFFPLTIFLF